MQDARALIAVLRDLNETPDRKVALFTSSLVSLFGSTPMFNAFLAEIDTSLATGTISEAVRTRAANLAQTYIPQVAGLNSIADIDPALATVEGLRAISNDSAEHRLRGTQTILAALNRILREVEQIA